MIRQNLNELIFKNKVELEDKIWTTVFKSTILRCYLLSYQSSATVDVIAMLET